MPTQPIQDIRAEVRELLEQKLMGTDNAGKTASLHKLADFFTMDNGEDGIWQKEEHRRVVSEWNGCHMVLVMLRNELASSGGPNRDVVYGAIRFLGNWNIDSRERSDEFSRFDGVATIVHVLTAGEFYKDNEIIHGTMICFLNFTSDNDAKRLGEIFDRKGYRHIIRAMSAHSKDAHVQTLALTILDRMAEAADQQQRKLLFEEGMTAAAATAYVTYVDSDSQISSLCSNLLLKMCS